MYEMLRSRSPIALLRTEAVPLVAAMAVAEVAYKFHSFTLECLAFLVTWTALGWGWSLARRGAQKVPRGA